MKEKKVKKNVTVAFYNNHSMHSSLYDGISYLPLSVGILK